MRSIVDKTLTCRGVIGSQLLEEIQSISSHPGIDTLVLFISNNSFAAPVFPRSVSLANCVQHIPSQIKRLRLKLCEHSFDLNQLIAAIKAIPEYITELDLTDMHLGRLTGDELAQIFEAIPNHICHLGLQRNELSLLNARVVAKSLQKISHTVTSLDLSEYPDVDLSNWNATYIADLLNNLPERILTLYFESNALGQIKGLSEICAAFQRNLRGLYLGSNSLATHKVEELYVLSKLPNQLKFLSLKENSIITKTSSKPMLFNQNSQESIDLEMEDDQEIHTVNEFLTLSQAFPVLPGNIIHLDLGCLDLSHEDPLVESAYIKAFNSLVLNICKLSFTLGGNDPAADLKGAQNDLITQCLRGTGVTIVNGVKSPELKEVLNNNLQNKKLCMLVVGFGLNKSCPRLDLDVISLIVSYLPLARSAVSSKQVLLTYPEIPPSKDLDTDATRMAKFAFAKRKSRFFIPLTLPLDARVSSPILDAKGSSNALSLTKAGECSSHLKAPGTVAFRRKPPSVLAASISSIDSDSDSDLQFLPPGEKSANTSTDAAGIPGVRT